MAKISYYLLMIKKNKILTSNNEINQTSKCKNCYIIRFFLLAVVFIILFALIQSENLHYLNFVTPTNAASLIIILGIIMFLIKLTNYLLDKKKR